MPRVIAFLGGFVLALALLAGAGFAAVYTGIFPVRADVKPSQVERWVAKTMLRIAIQRETQGLTDPYSPSEPRLGAAIKLYGTNCAFCHGTADGKPSNAARGFSIKAPQLAEDGVEDDPVPVTYWKVKHGIRFTGMPAFGPTLSDEQIWALAEFLRQMDRLPPKLDAEWRALPSSAK